MRRFTNHEKIDGEMAVSKMSEKAKRYYYGTDPLAVYRYATAKADEDVYAIKECGEWTLDLTFEEAEQYLEDMQTAIEESEDFDA